MDLKEKLAESFLEEALNDFEAAKLLLDSKKYSLAIFHMQQAAEKAAKCLLVVLGYGLIPTHKISPILASELSRLGKEGEKLVEILADFEFVGTKTRYPIIKSGKIISPSKLFTEDEAFEYWNELISFFDILREIIEKKKPEIVKIFKELE